MSNAIFRNKISKKFPATQAEWDKPIYQSTWIVGIALLAVSAMLSAKFYQVFFEGMGRNGFYLSLSISAAVSAAIYALSDYLFRYIAAGNGHHPLIALLIAAVAWNAYTDILGSPEWAHEMVKAPENKQADQLMARMDALDGKEAAILSQYDWKGKKGTRASIVWALSGKYKKLASKNLAALDAISAEKSALAASLSNSNLQHTAAIGRHNKKLSTLKGSARGGSIALTLAFLFLSWWRAKFEADYDKETPAVPKETAAIEKLKELARKAYGRQETEETAAVPADAENAFYQLASESPELFEELLARWENEKTRLPGKD